MLEEKKDIEKKVWELPELTILEIIEVETGTVTYMLNDAPTNYS